jgi:hypothetical protein
MTWLISLWQRSAWLRAAVLLLAALAAAAIVVIYALDHLMDSRKGVSDDGLVVALAAIGVTLPAGLVLNWVGNATLRSVVPALAIFVMLAFGAAPFVVDAGVQQQRRFETAAEESQLDADVLAAIDARREDIDARIAARQPYAGQEALAFVDSIGSADLSFRGLSDHSAEVLDLLQRALDEKIVDPNVLVRGPRPVDISDEPLFVHIYRARIRPCPRCLIRQRDWHAFKLLIDHGADLALAGALPIAEDLRKKVMVERIGVIRLE